MTKTIKLQCSCGETQLEVSGDPIMVTECLCNSCRAAAARLERLKGARKILNEYGATRFGEYRKDRCRGGNATRRAHRPVDGD